MVNYDTQGFESYTNFAKLDGAMQGYTDNAILHYCQIKRLYRLSVASRHVERLALASLR